MGQDRSRSQPLTAILAEAGIGRGSRVGVVDWKYHGPEVGPMPRCGSIPRLTWWTSWRADRAFARECHRSADDPSMACAPSTAWTSRVLEFAATCISAAVRRVLLNLQIGMTEFEAIQQAQLNGLPFSMHPILVSGSRTALGLASPSDRRLGRGEPFSVALGGGVRCVAGPASWYVSGRTARRDPRLRGSPGRALFLGHRRMVQSHRPGRQGRGAIRDRPSPSR